MIDRAAPLWAVTTFFNPAGYASRRANFRAFRARLAVPLLAVELAYGAEFELAAADADILLQRRGRDVLWQKERLLNLALDALPPSCTQVAWLDCDVVFARDDWHQEASRLLEDAPAVQPFGRALHLARGVDAAHAATSAALVQKPSFQAAIARGANAAHLLSGLTEQTRGPAARGLAWCARRELLARHRYFDCCPVGGGDSAMLCALHGEFDMLMEQHCMNAAQRRRYLRWARPLHADVLGRAAFVDGDLYHLWHGDLAHRRTRSRHAELAPFEFDPDADLAIDASGAWRWASDKPALHAHVRDYFAARREDG